MGRAAGRGSFTWLARFVMQILDRAKAHFDCLPNVVEVSIGEGQQLTVVGDVHGQMPVRCCWSGLPRRTPR